MTPKIKIKPLRCSHSVGQKCQLDPLIRSLGIQCQEESFHIVDLELIALSHTWEKRKESGKPS